MHVSLVECNLAVGVEVPPVDVLPAALTDLMLSYDCYVGPRRLRDQWLKVLAQALPLSLTNLHLRVGCHDIGPDGAAALASVLLQLQLRRLRLDFSRCPIGDAGLSSLAESLPHTLQALNMDLMGCGIHERGARALARAIPPTLLDLDLNFWLCDIGDAGAVAIAAGLPRCLVSLSLNFLGANMDGFADDIAYDNDTEEWWPELFDDPERLATYYVSEVAAREVVAQIPAGLNTLSLTFDYRIKGKDEIRAATIGRFALPEGYRSGVHFDRAD